VGVDMLDVVFRLERTFGIKILPGDLERYAERRTPPDLQVRDLVALVRAKRPVLPMAAGVIAGDVACLACGYNLRGLPPFGNCPECGTPAAYEAQIRRALAQVLVDALGVDTAAITDEASVFRDLGAG
jgi:acyl carrier protein